MMSSRPKRRLPPPRLLLTVCAALVAGAAFGCAAVTPPAPLVGAAAATPSPVSASPAVAPVPRAPTDAAPATEPPPTPELPRVLVSPRRPSRLEAAGIKDVIGLEHRDPAALARFIEHPVPEVRREVTLQIGRTRDPAALPVLLQALKSPDPAVRYRAVIGLGLCGHPDALPALLPLLKEAKITAAVISLARLGDPRAVGPLLAELAARQDADSRQVIIQALSVLDDPRAVAPLAALLDDQSEFLRVEALKALGRLGPRLAAPAREKIRAALMSEAPAERSAAVGALAGADAVGELAERLHDPHAAVRLAAVAALAADGTPEALRELALLLSPATCPAEERAAVVEALGQAAPDGSRALLEHALGDPVPAVRLAAVNALALLGGAEAAAALARRLDAGEPVEAIRITTVAALGWTRSSTARPRLLRYLGDAAERVREAAALGLGELAGDPEVLTALLGRMSDPSPRVRKAAVKSLARLPEARATRALLAALADPDWDVRWNAARGLGERGEPATAEPLAARLAAEPEAQVRGSLVKALGRLGGPTAVAALARTLADEDSGVSFQAYERLLELGCTAQEARAAAGIPEPKTEPEEGEGPTPDAGVE